MTSTMNQNILEKISRIRCHNEQLISLSLVSEEFSKLKQIYHLDELVATEFIKTVERLFIGYISESQLNNVLPDSSEQDFR